MSDTNSKAKQHAEFLLQAYFGLVLRGYDRESEIPDSILRGVWRHGKALAKAMKKSKARVHP